MNATVPLDARASTAPASRPPARRPLAVGLAALVLATSLVTAPARVAHAEVPLLRDNFYEIAPFYQSGGISLGGHTATVSGLHIQERNGFFSKALWTVVVATLMALGQSDTEYLGSDYGPGYRIDYYRYKTTEELAAEEAEREATVDAAAANEYQTNLYIFWPTDGLGDTAGYIFETYPLSMNFDALTLEFGLGFSSVRSKCGPEMNGGVGRCRSRSFSMPTRLNVDIAGMALFDIQFDLNFLAFGDDARATTYDHGFRTGLTFHPWERLFVRGGVTIPDFDFDELGFQLEAGLRF